MYKGQDTVGDVSETNFPYFARVHLQSKTFPCRHKYFLSELSFCKYFTQRTCKTMDYDLRYLPQIQGVSKRKNLKKLW